MGNMREGIRHGDSLPKVAIAEQSFAPGAVNSTRLRLPLRLIACPQRARAVMPEEP